MNLGIITNPLAGRNRSRPVILDSRADLAGVPMVVFSDEADLAGQIAAMIDRGVSELVVDGGDGTVAASISALFRMGETRPLPRLVLVPSGTTNLVAAKLGIRGPRHSVISRLLKAAPRQLDEQTLVRSPVEVDRGGGIPQLHGFLVGLGAFHSGTTSAQRGARCFRLRSGAAVAFGLASALWRGLAGDERERFLAGDSISLEVDRTPEPGDRRLLVLVSSFDSLMLGLRPFWGAGSRSLNWLSVKAHPRALGRALPRVLAGRPARWMDEAGYRSGRANALRLQTDRPFILDGEVVAPSPSGILDIRSARPLRFLRLA